MFITSTERHVQKSLFIESSHIQKDLYTLQVMFKKKKNRESSHFQLAFFFNIFLQFFKFFSKDHYF